MHHLEFWAVSLREYDLVTRARIKAKDSEIEARRVLNQELGVLTQFAFHDPKKMPDFTKAVRSKANEAPRNKTHELEQLRAVFMGMHFQGKKKGR